MPYVALRDSDELLSFVVGAFSDEKLAQDACQEDENDTAEGWRRDAVTLEWKDAEAHGWGTDYAVVLVEMNQRVA